MAHFPLPDLGVLRLDEALHSSTIESRPRTTQNQKCDSPIVGFEKLESVSVLEWRAVSSHRTPGRAIPVMNSRDRSVETQAPKTPGSVSSFLSLSDFFGRASSARTNARHCFSGNRNCPWLPRMA